MKNKPSLNLLVPLFVAIVTVSFSCHTEKSEDEMKMAELKAEVIRVHDDAMAKMGQLSKLKSKLVSKMETMGNQDSLNHIKQTVIQITAADEAMMDWMRNFSKNFPAGFLIGEMNQATVD
ncbi:hypothetical protein [uncultured Algoriphagus sp.]|uniref:hypothetical protein n=1 Tax=uncultured Algoriphagus sp. TaxID=417365 RepID=UPI0030EDF992|tara:strand:- start:250 stop:609 length:360 start_codon:yes stop_codon:yes gene_type:complete